MPRILTLDIETKPAQAYVWRFWKENIGVDQVIEPGGVICFGAKWFGEPEVEFYSDWQHGHQAMIEAAHRLISEADAVVTYNGEKFDIRKLTGEFLLCGLPPVPPITSIDLLKTIKWKFGFDMNRLAFIAPLLDVGEKMKHEGFELWVKVMDGDVRAQRKMERYCKRDVRITDKLYRKIRPFIMNHPHLGNVGSAECGACGSRHVQSRGYRRTKSFRIQRLHCQDCGSWQDGKRQKVT